jgi:alanyl-tRNA synthetase
VSTVDLVLDASPFYAKGGGQIGDRGSARGPSGAAEITDTVSLDGGQHLHRAVVTEGVIGVGDVLQLEVDQARRRATAANHSATHLLNAALREVLGPHVRQAGSLVEPERLRFDFTHPAALTAGELERVQHLVNTWILEDHGRAVEELPQDEAKASGAISLEGEDYGGGIVRVVSFDGVSRELCGGTHVGHTSFIGSLRIRSEHSVAAGVRRISAVTRFGALELAEEQQEALSSVASALHASPRDVVAAARRLASPAGRSGAGRSGAGKSGTGKSGAGRPAVDQETAERAMSDFSAGVIDVSAGRLDAEPAALRTAALEAASCTGRVAALWSEAGGSVRLAVAVPERYRATVSAADLVRSMMAQVGGSGGGSAAVAQGGGGTLHDGTSPRDMLIALLS